jgi:hypothetical protein
MKREECKAVGSKHGYFYEIDEAAAAAAPTNTKSGKHTRSWPSLSEAK